MPAPTSQVPSVSPSGSPTVNYDEKVAQLAQDIERLKSAFEQYFLGFERLPPLTLRKQVERAMRELVESLHLIQNTAVRFKIKSFQAKMISLSRLWDRNLQQIEDGTFKRDRFRLKLRLQHEDDKPKATAHTAVVASKPEAPAEPAKRSPAVESLMNQFLSAKSKCAESTHGISYDSFAKSLAQQTQAIKSKFNCKTVRFKVVVENGKTKLKATPVQ